MLAPILRYFLKKAELRNPKAYKILFVPSYTLMGMRQGEGWYIDVPGHNLLGPLPSQENAENQVLDALGEIRGRALSPEERREAHEFWGKK